MKTDSNFYIYTEDMLHAFLQERLVECATHNRWGKEAPTVGRKTHCEWCGHPVKVHSYCTPAEAQGAIAKYIAMSRAYRVLTMKQRTSFARLHANILGVARFLEYYAHVSEPPNGCELYVGALESFNKGRKEETSNWSHEAACLALDDNGFGGKKNIPRVLEAERALALRFDFGSRCRDKFVAGEAVDTHWPENVIQREEALRELGGVSQIVVSPRHLSREWREGAAGVFDDGKAVRGRRAIDRALGEFVRLARKRDLQVQQFTFADFAHPRVLSHMLHTGQSRCAVHLDNYGVLLGIQMDEEHVAVGVPTFGRDTAERSLVRLYEYYKNGEDLA